VLLPGFDTGFHIGMSSLTTEIAILGGGPAAMVLARRLTGMGYGVLVITRPRQPRTLEGFSERTLMLCGRFCGLEDWVRGREMISRDVCWNGERSAANREAVIDRGDLDNRIRASAQREGIQILDGRVSAVSEQDEGWRLAVKSHDADGKVTDRTITARFLVEARGRAAPAAGQSRVRGPGLVCLSRRWRFGPAENSRAGIGAFGDGWAWFIRDKDGAGILQFFVDAASVRSRPELNTVYAQFVAALPEAGPWLQGGQEEGEVFARHAGMVVSHDLCSPRHIRIGDAAMAIDPLSGHGVYKAISNALAAVPVINTLMRRPDAAGLAIDFYKTRVTDDFWVSARLARDFYREERRWTDQPFWQERQRWPDEAPAHALVEEGVVRIERRPVSIENYVEERDVLVTPDQPRGVLHLGGIPAVDAWRMLTSDLKAGDQKDTDRKMPEVLANHFGVPLSTADQALRWFAERRLGGLS
jgi:flavin-dependent dehydrogenase